jgi:hypothetical protein
MSGKKIGTPVSKKGKGSKAAGSKRRSKRTETYSTYIYRVLNLSLGPIACAANCLDNNNYKPGRSSSPPPLNS